MKIDKYEQAAFRHLTQWLDRLDREGIDALRQSCAEIGRQNLLDYARENAEEIYELSTATPRTRDSLLRKVEDIHTRHALLMLACYRVRRGWAWLKCAADRAADTSIDVHPIEMLTRASDAAELLLSEGLSLWPFDDGSDPLNEGLPDDD